MKNKSTLFTSLVILALATSLSSCQKIIDKIFHGHGNEEKACEIIKVKQDLFGSDVRTGMVYNNAHGNPDSVIFDQGGGAASYYYFKYDMSNRLIEYSAYYDRDPENYYYKHYYGYTGSKITSDSALWREAGTWTRKLWLQYDAQGRVISESGTDTLLDDQPGSSQPYGPVTYTYDTDGNLETTPATSYDDKVSFLRTSKVWMFIERNYSENNPVGATQYNANDLPLGFSTDQGGTFLQFGVPLEIEYDCNNSGAGQWDY